MCVWSECWIAKKKKAQQRTLGSKLESEELQMCLNCLISLRWKYRLGVYWNVFWFLCLFVGLVSFLSGTSWSCARRRWRRMSLCIWGLVGKTHIAMRLIYELGYLIRKLWKEICVVIALTLQLVRQVRWKFLVFDLWLSFLCFVFVKVIDCWAFSQCSLSWSDWDRAITEV